MKNNEGRFSAWVGKAARWALIGTKRLVGTAKRKIAIDHLFQSQAVRLKRISTNIVNLDPTVLGIFDRNQVTLTVRSSDRLEVGELFESEHIQYRVEAIRPEEILFALDPGHSNQSVACRVALLKAI